MRHEIDKINTPGYKGEAKKCPECGSAVKTAVKTCQNCGHSFALKKDEDAQEGTLTSTVNAEQETTGWLRAIGSKLGLTKDDLVAEHTTENIEEEQVTDVSTDDRLSKIEDVVEKSAASVEALAGRIADIALALASKKEQDEEEHVGPSSEEVYHRLDDVAKSLDAIRGDVDKLAEGSTQQHETQESSVQKSTDPLAGLLTD